MDDLYLNNTISTPEIDFRNSGHLSIKGKSLPEDPKKFYDPLLKWANDVSAKEVTLDIKLIYVNTSSSKKIIDLVRHLDNNNKIKKIKLNWFYDPDDMDMLEFGESIQHSLRRTKAKYIEYNEDEKF